MAHWSGPVTDLWWAEETQVLGHWVPMGAADFIDCSRS